MKKRAVLFFLVCFFLAVSYASASLGISPAIKDITFVPNAEHEIVFYIVSDDFKKKVDIYVEGDLANYTRLSKTEATGSDSFTLYIKFPDSVERPGLHGISVGVRERAPENAFIGTVIDIISSVRVFVPYPGRYAEGSLNVPDGNVDELLPVELYVINRGRENIEFSPSIKFLNAQEDVMSIMEFEPVSLRTGEERYFRKYLITSGFKQGLYTAEAAVDYGELLLINRSFRIGSLDVQIVNFTTRLSKGGIQKFLVDINSRWNNRIDEIYAEVNVSNLSSSIVFRTPSLDLAPWSSQTLVGFLDTEFMEGEYKTEIELSYQGSNTYASGVLFVYRKTNYTFVVIGAVIVIALAFWLAWKIRKKSKKKKIKRAQK